MTDDGDLLNKAMKVVTLLVPKGRIVVFFCLVFLWGMVNAADNNTKLVQVLSQITRVKIDITKKEHEQTSVEQQLNTLKKRIKVLSGELKETTRNLKRQKSALTKLTKDQVNQQAKLKDSQDKLVSQINLANQVIQPSYFKIILRGEDKITPALILVYHRYIFMARLEQMTGLKTTLERLEKNRREISRQAETFAKLEKKQARQKLELETTNKERCQIRDSLKDKIAKQNNRLKQLLNAKQNLERLVGVLTQHKFTMSSGLKAKFCQDFVWPTAGTITTHFGSPIEQSSWKWSGVIIRAAMKQEVRAASAGKVVYADWLTGYGLLLIIDHGSGYMSLYGYNSSFRKKLNDLVAAGEVVATVGKSDSENYALYFAIRYNGKPIDPAGWCR